MRAIFYWAACIKGALAPGRLAVLLLATVTACTSASAQSKKARRKTTMTTLQSERRKADEQVAKAREQYIEATKEVKATHEPVLANHEANARKAAERVSQLRDLYTQGLISKRELEESEKAVADARSKAAEVRQKIAMADAQIANTLVEIEADEQMAKAPPVPIGKMVRTTSYLRYNAPGAWSLSEAWKVQQFFLQKFGRPLPVSAFGQSAIHDRWGYDHRNAIDVPLNPDGVEGQSLINFLRGSGIPFSAFRSAIPGTATGPHIHVGRPSHRR
jgi:hypothetical protein